MQRAGPAQGGPRPGGLSPSAPYVGPALVRPSCRHSHDVSQVHATHSSPAAAPTPARLGGCGAASRECCGDPASAAQAQALAPALAAGPVLALHVVQPGPAMADRDEQATARVEVLVMRLEWKGVGEGESVPVRVAHGARRIIKKTNN